MDITGPDKLGHTFVDQITGFEGVANAYVYYISGCNQVLLVPKVDKEGKYRDGMWIDAQRLKIKAKKRIILNNDITPGFDQLPTKA